MVRFRQHYWFLLLLLVGLFVRVEAREYRRARPGYEFQFPRL